MSRQQQNCSFNRLGRQQIHTDNLSAAFIALCGNLRPTARGVASTSPAVGEVVF